MKPLSHLVLTSNLFLFSGIAKANDFNDYWYAGEAEISSYTLEQSRYGEIHQGEAVLVYVTEPFSKEKHVKLDDWQNNSEDNVSVMKLNMTKSFLTGIYPYSMMMSAFTPISDDKHPKAFKVTSSSQEWCGHTWFQANLENEGYRLRAFSYFESDGDVDLKTENVILEDELWNKVRLQPESLPIGEVTLLPSSFYLRLRHREFKPETAKLSLTTVSQSEYGEKAHSKYSIKYANRSLEIFFEAEFPHKILGWEETYVGLFDETGGLTTKAKMDKSIKSAYWQQNKNVHRAKRKALNLSTD